MDGTIPRQALPRWNACQRYLIDRLSALGADPQAKDASRVLRLVDTVNTKSGNICRVVHVEAGQDGQPRYNFEYLAEMLLPAARWTIEQQRQDRADRRDRQQLKLLPGGKADNLRGFSGRQLAWDRLEDLRTLATLRNGVREGERMQHLFWRLNFLLLSGATHSGQMYHEAAALAGELDPGWNYRSKELRTINLFRITPDEQAQLRTIIGTDVAKERDRKRHEVKRRAAGAVDRETYLDAAQAKRVQAQALKAEGLSVRAIAERMGASVGAVAGYLKAAGVRSKSVRITADQVAVSPTRLDESCLQGVQGPSVLLMAKPPRRGPLA